MSSDSILGAEVLAAVQNFEQGLDAPSVQPAILAHRNFDPQTVSEVWSGYYNDSWAMMIKAKIDDGFVIVRIQTELHGNVHATMIYMIKPKS